jgi:hypothetical protein
MKSQSVTWMLPSCLSELAILEEDFGMISARKLLRAGAASQIKKIKDHAPVAASFLAAIPRKPANPHDHNYAV